jgi:GTP-binding protein Era
LIRKVDCPVFLVLTKIDLVPKDHLLPLIDTLTKQFNFAQIIPVSARKRDGLDLLVRKIVDALPKGERYYPADQYTDQPQRFHGGGTDPRKHPCRNRRRSAVRFCRGD